jgi:hypothetical protein
MAIMRTKCRPRLFSNMKREMKPGTIVPLGMAR